jgi:hypothetical protein
MRGKDEQQLDVFSYISPEQRVPQDHPLRSLRAMTNEALRQLKPRFNNLYSKTGRPRLRRRNCCGRSSCRRCTPAQRTHANGAAGLQPAVPLVCGFEHG